VEKAYARLHSPEWGVYSGMKISKQQLLRRANEIVGECYELVSGFDSQLSAIRIVISSRMTRAAGKARPGTGEITLALPYFEDPKNFEQHFRNTVTHEIAHILSPPFRRAGSRKTSQHGPAWKSMHRRLGGTGERCHDLDLAVGYERKTRQRAVRTEVLCSCGCGQPMPLGPTQLKRYQNGERYVLKGHGGRRRDSYRLW